MKIILSLRENNSHRVVFQYEKCAYNLIFLFVISTSKRHKK